MTPSHTGAILLKCLGPLSAPGNLPEALTTLARERVPLAESVAAHASVEPEEIYAYLFSRAPAAITAAVLANVAGAARALPNLKIGRAHV